MAADGRQALERSEREQPDLVIADVMMPVFDGVALCRRLKAGGLTAHIPVILMSAAAEAAPPPSAPRWVSTTPDTGSA
jgi:CheY-like chemotaxis protein